jgi:hypothetical protein
MKWPGSRSGRIGEQKYLMPKPIIGELKKRWKRVE